jgi:hypothetical protein
MTYQHRPSRGCPILCFLARRNPDNSANTGGSAAFGAVGELLTLTGVSTSLRRLFSKIGVNE